MSERVALVSGGTRGLGKAIAERLLREGWQVFGCARREPEEAIGSGDRRARFVAADVRNPESVAALVQTVIDAAGRIDLLVNNAGGSPAARVVDSSPALIEKVIALNLLAPLYLARAAYQALREAGGSVVNIASISGLRPAPGTVAYGAAKAGLISATKGLAMEWGPDVRVNAVVVGLVENIDQAEHYGGPEGVVRISGMLPMKRMARGADVAGCVAWLASEEAAYLSGAAIELHGGGEVPAFLALVQGSSG